MNQKSPERKYAELISYIKILAYRATNEAVSNQLKAIAIYLEEIRKQKHLCMITETDRIEYVRFKEILEYIDNAYDGTEDSVEKICIILNKRKDVSEILKNYRNYRDNKKEIER